MLQSLYVKNLALIDEAEVTFSEGLNILSGETGAGKSIIIGSIGIALGEKIPKEFVREGATSALVELVFSVNDDVTRTLAKYDIEPDDGNVILSRKIENGHSRAKINGETVTAAMLREIASVLIDIHGQHEHQSLLNVNQHIHFLDQFGKQDILPALSDYQETYRIYQKLKKEFEDTDVDEETRQREISLLSYEIDEISNAALKTGEDEALETSYKKLANMQKIMDACEMARLQMNTAQTNASEMISRAYRELLSVSEYDEGLSQLAAQLGTIESMTSDFNHDMDYFMSNTDYDERLFRETEERLDTVNHLKSKYGTTIEKIHESLDEKKQRLEALSDLSAHKTAIEAKLLTTQKELAAKAKELSDVRKKWAKELDTQIICALKDLNFLDVDFQTSFSEDESYQANGRDHLSFMISVNPGEPLKSLEKIASGGELSRVMLALKTILADQDEIGTLIFDEIDTGISGRTAQAVSVKLGKIAQKRQVICITHLPQIAAMADTHFLIEKKSSDGTTVSTISQLSEEESISELARMLGGVRITDAVLENAREMKALAKEAKK